MEVVRGRMTQKHCARQVLHLKYYCTKRKGEMVNDSEISFDISPELERMGLPPYTLQYSSKHPKLGGVIAHISPVYHALPLYIEAGKQAPKTVHLVTNTEWIKRIYDDAAKTSKLYLRQGYTFDERGNCYLIVYPSPPIICYFVNLFPHDPYSDHPAAQFVVSPACELERYFDGPMCGSDWWDKETNDKILTRLIVREEGVCVPDFLAFVKPPIMPNKSPIYNLAIEKGEIVVLESITQEEQIKKSIESVLQKFKWDGVVVKPSGSRYCGCDGVQFFASAEFKLIVQYTQKLVERIGPGEGVLVDRKISYKPFIVDDRLIDCCFRVMLARSVTDKIGSATNSKIEVSGRTDAILGRFSDWGKPVAVCFGGYFESFEYYAKNVQLTEQQKTELLESIHQLGPRVYNGFQKYEKTRKLEIDEPKQAQIDFVAVDVCVEEREGKIVPVLVEVNDHDSDGHLFLNQLFPEKSGHSFHTWVRTMLFRAALYLQSEKTVSTRPYFIQRKTI